MTAPPKPSKPLPSSQRRRNLRRFRWRKSVHRFLTWALGARYHHGVTRWVFLVGKRAYKVPRFDSGLSLMLTGWLANRNEARAWYAAEELWHGDPNCDVYPPHVLAPVVGKWFGGLLIAMRRCEHPDPLVVEEFLRSADRTWWAYYCGDMHPGNFGLLDGRMVCIDYPD